MTKIKLEYLIWDRWNEIHVKKHGVSKTDIERAISNIQAFRYGYRGRIILICRVQDKSISVIVDRKSEGKYYVVTARPADKKERKIAYEKNR